MLFFSKGPQEELFIDSIEGQGSQFGFMIFVTNQLENQNSFSYFKQFFEFSPTETCQLTQNNQKRKQQNNQKNGIIISSRQTQSRASIQINNYDLLKNQINSQFHGKFQSLKSIKITNEDNKSPNIDPSNSEIQVSHEFTNCSETKLDPKIENYLSGKKILLNQNLNTEDSKLSDVSSIPSSSYQETISQIPKPIFSQINQDQTFNILLVDDTPFNLLILENYLTNNSDTLPKFQILKAYDGKKAIDIFTQQNKIIKNCNQNEINIILMDCEMPILDGYRATKEIKELINSGDYKVCRIIAYTANSGLDEEVKCMNFGFDGYLIKPSTKSDFISLILNNLNI